MRLGITVASAVLVLGGVVPCVREIVGSPSACHIRSILPGEELYAQGGRQILAGRARGGCFPEPALYPASVSGLAWRWA